MTAPGNFTAGDVLQAADMNALPAGIVDYKLLTTDFYYSTIADVTGMSITFTADPNRFYRLSFEALLQGSSQFYILVDASFVQRGQNASSVFIHTYASVVVTGLSGSTVVKVQAQSNGGTLRLECDNDRPGVLLVEDIGGS